MKKHIYGRQLKRDIHERKALFKGLMTSLVMHERIQTTEEKAKAIKGSVEKLVTKAKKSGLNSTADLLPYLQKEAVSRMISEIAPRFTNRPGGYTRIIKLGRRYGDNARVVTMEWVEGSSKLKVQSSKLDKNIAVEQIEAVKTPGSKRTKTQKKTETKAVKKKNTDGSKKQKAVKASQKTDKKIDKKGKKS